jgi:hypothetical protein
MGRVVSLDDGEVVCTGGPRQAGGKLSRLRNDLINLDADSSS